MLVSRHSVLALRSDAVQMPTTENAMSGCAFPGCAYEAEEGAAYNAHGPCRQPKCICRGKRNDPYCHAYVAPAPQPCPATPYKCAECGDTTDEDGHLGYGLCRNCYLSAKDNIARALAANRAVSQPIPSPATPDAPVCEPYCSECGVTTEEDGHLGYGLCRDCYLNTKDDAARELAAHCARPAAPKLGVGDALRVDDVTLEHRLLDLHQPAKLNFNHAREWAIEYAEEVKQLRAQLAALTTPTLNTGTSPAEVIDALTTEVAGLRERLQTATGLLRTVDKELPGIRQVRAFLAAGAK